MLGAGLIARNAVKHGLKVKPWVKTSLAPGSQVVTEYLEASGLQKDLNKIGYNLVGYGCTSCIGNSGPLPDPVTKAVNDADLVVCAVLSGNRNFEGRVNPLTRANYLASPMLVVVYALAGSMKIDITKDPIGIGKGGKPVYLKDIWPSNMEVQKLVDKFVTTKAFKKRYADVFKGDKFWRGIKTKPSLTYAWDDKSTYVRNPPYFDGMGKTPGALSNIAGRPPARPVRRFDHDRPHLARRLDQEGQPGRRLSGRARRRGQGLQPVRHAARQSRGDDARHLRQHPPQERDGAGHRGRLHPPLPDRPARADLRRGDALQEGAHAADPDRRQGIRHRQLARLGRQGREPAGRQGRGVRDLRAHPSLEPGRHGRAAAAVQGRHDAQDAQPHRPRELRRERHRRRAQARHGRAAHHPPPRRHQRDDHPDLPHRYRSRRSSTSRTAACCTTCCATWRTRPERRDHGDGAGRPLRRHGRQQCVGQPPAARRLQGADARRNSPRRAPASSRRCAPRSITSCGSTSTTSTRSSATRRC